MPVVNGPHYSFHFLDIHTKLLYKLFYFYTCLIPFNTLCIHIIKYQSIKKIIFTSVKTLIQTASIIKQIIICLKSVIRSHNYLFFIFFKKIQYFFRTFSQCQIIYMIFNRCRQCPEGLIQIVKILRSFF